MSRKGVEVRVSVPELKLRVETHPRVHEANPDPVVLAEARLTRPWVAFVSWCGIGFRADEQHGTAGRTTCSNCKIAKAKAEPVVQAVAS